MIDIDFLSKVIGWIYFTAWSISFYPQIVINYKRKSVTGLNFDYLTLNEIGFICYSIFNLSLYFVPKFREEYLNHNPNSSLPVALNDIGFSIHATLATSYTIYQCLIYERSDQKISPFTIFFILLIISFSVLLSILSSLCIISKLNYLYFYSTVKLFITMIKYIPQAWFNYRRKSTIGWSIENILLDLIGGLFSIIQIFLLAYKDGNWQGIFGNPTKFGLGLLSLLFDLLFIFQHYFLYTERESKLKCSSKSSKSNKTSSISDKSFQTKVISVLNLASI